MKKTKLFLIFSEMVIMAAGRVAHFSAPHSIMVYSEPLYLRFSTIYYTLAGYVTEIVIDDRVGEGHNVLPRKRVTDAWT